MRSILSTDYIDRALASALDTLLWSTTGDDGAPLDGDYTADDFTRKARAEVRRDLRAFLRAVRAEGLHEWVGSPERTGHDWTLTRNRHGAGFWDRGYRDDGRLTTLAHESGSCEPYVYRRRVHVG